VKGLKRFKKSAWQLLLLKSGLFLSFHFFIWQFDWTAGQGKTCYKPNLLPNRPESRYKFYGGVLLLVKKN